MPPTDLAARTHRRLLVSVGVIVAVTVGAMIALWPSSADLPRADDGERPALVRGTVLTVATYEGEPDPYLGGDGEMARVEVRLDEGVESGTVLVLDLATDGYPDFDPGDVVQLSASEVDGVREWYIVDFERTGALAWLLGLFVAAVLVVSRWHGLRSLLGLGVSLFVVVRFVVPGILAGESPFLVALVGAVAVMLVSLYLSHGVNEMTTAAVVGTGIALAITIGLGAFFIRASELTGFSSEEATLARFTVEGLDLQGLILAGLTIGALGVLDDVTVSQASTVFALHDTDRRLGWRALFGRAMGVGRDHIASTVNTLFLAYAGASLALLVVFSTNGLPVLETVNSEIFAEELVRTIVGSLGIIAAVPLTTALAATLAVRRPLDAPPVRPVHAHDPDTTAVTTAPEREEDAERVDESALDDDERARRAWARYLRERGRPPEPTPERRE